MPYEMKPLACDPARIKRHVRAADEAVPLLGFRQLGFSDARHEFDGRPTAPGGGQDLVVADIRPHPVAAPPRDGGKPHPEHFQAEMPPNSAS